MIDKELVAATSASITLTILSEADSYGYEIIQRVTELTRGELEFRLGHLETCLGKLPEEQRALVEGYYYRRNGIEKLAEESGRTVAATYKALQRIRHALQLCIESSTQSKGTA